MSSIVSKKLSIDKNNIEQYCDAQNVSFNVADHAWRKWLNGSTDGYITLKNEGKAVIYPTDTAHPFKADSLISASRSAGTAKVELLVGGTSVHSESFTSGTQKEKSKSDITDAAISNSTKATEIKWHVNGKNGDNQRGDLIELTLYFYQYAMSANIGTNVNAVKSVTVSNAAPYHGDSTTFSATLIKGATWDGWYSDAACTALVSTDQNYTITAGSDVTLYAKATVNASIYSCNAIAKDGISSVSISDDSVVDGESCTFSATASEHYEFAGWYSDEGCTVLVSTANPYTATISADTTLYAKATAIMYSASVGTPEHGTAAVTPSSVPYGGTVTFSCEVTQANRGFYGWYADPEYMMLVSKDATYSCEITKDTILYPKTGHELHTLVIHPVKLFDPLPYRGLVNGVNPSQSIPVDVAKIQNISLAQASTTVYAYQPHVTSAPHTYGMSMWFGDNPLPEIPDNATVVDVHAEFGYSLADAGYDSIKIGMGRFEYVSDNDETPITDNASFAYIDEGDNTEDQTPSEDVDLQTLLNRTSNYKDPMARATDAKELAIRSGTSIIQDDMVVPINDTTLYPVSVSDLKNGKLGFQINCVSQSNSGSPRRFRLHAFDLYVTYTIEDVSYKCDAISDGHVDVTIQSHDNAPGVECTWIANPEGGYRFAGWYSDANYTNLVSTELEYTTVVNAPITLYAKSKYHSRVVTRVLEIPFGKGATYLTGKDLDGNILNTESGSGWVPDFELSDYGWLSSIAGVSDIKATAATCNKSSKPYAVKAVLNDAAKAILFPNATAHLVRLDSHGCFGRAAIGARVVTNKITNPNTGADYITPTFGGISGSVWRPNMIHDVELNYENIRREWVLNSTRETEICYLLVQGTSSIYRAIGIDQIKLTGYFEEYDFAASIANGSKGVRSVSVSKDIGYEGDEVTYSANVASYATFDGWFSDEACTNLISTEKEYAVVPDANLTLYAKGTVSGNVYSCSAVAKDNIASVSVSDTDMVEGGTCTFAATANPGSKFLGWYSDEACTQLVSEDASYAATISTDTTLYAKGEKILYTISIGDAEHCSPYVNRATAYYEDAIEFHANPEEGYRCCVWYLDEAHTRPVSEKHNTDSDDLNDISLESVEFLITALKAELGFEIEGTEIKLWPEAELKVYEINFGARKNETFTGSANVEAIVFNKGDLTTKELSYLRTGEYDKITTSKIIERKAATGSIQTADASSAITCTHGQSVAFYAHPVTIDSSEYIFYFLGWGDKQYYCYTPTNKDSKYAYLKENTSENWCVCTAIPKDGISEASVSSPVLIGKYAAFYATPAEPGYTVAWYTDEACTVLANGSKETDTFFSNEQRYDYKISAGITEVTLYAKAIKDTYTIAAGGDYCCTTSASKEKAQYGDEVTFTCTVNSDRYEFIGWYVNEGYDGISHTYEKLTQLVSTSPTYTHTVTGKIKLYARTRIVGDYYALTVGRPLYIQSEDGFNDGNVHGGDYFFYVAILKDADFTTLEKILISYGTISALETPVNDGRVVDFYGIGGNDTQSENFGSVQCPVGHYALIFAQDASNYEVGKEDSSASSWPLVYKNGVRVSDNHVYLYQPAGNDTITSRDDTVKNFGITAIGAVIDSEGNEVDFDTSGDKTIADYVTHAEPIGGCVVYTGGEVTFDLRLKDGRYATKWCGADSNGEYTQIVSTSNPYTTTVSWSEGNHQLYLIAQLGAATTTGISLKLNNAWVEAKTVYAKVDGVWVEALDDCKSMLSQKDRTGTIVQIV